MRYNITLPVLVIGVFVQFVTFGQALRIPENNNFTSMIGRRISVTDVQIRWNAPKVNGRDGAIWGTNVAYFGSQVLGFGSNVASPWRAGADECTTISFSTDVLVNGSPLPAGKYALFLELGAEESTWIFNKNVDGWGTYFYDKNLDVLRVKTVQKKNQTNLVERLTYHFENQTSNHFDIFLDWERWSIPMSIDVDEKKTILADIKKQMSGALGFDPASLIAAAEWCVINEINQEQAMDWIISATSPSLGGVNSFKALHTKAELLFQQNKIEESKKAKELAIENGTIIELHQYGRLLLSQKKLDEATLVFEKNFNKYKGAWPTNAGLMRLHAAKGDFKKALSYAKAALVQAPDEINKQNLEALIKKLEAGQSIN